MKRLLRALFTKRWSLPCDICGDYIPCRVPFYWRKKQGETVRCVLCVSNRMFIISGGMFGKADYRTSRGINYFPPGTEPSYMEKQLTGGNENE